MGEKKKPKARICHSIRKISPEGMSLEENTLTVERENLQEVKEVFDKIWQKRK